MSPVVAEAPGEIYVVSTPYVGAMEGMHNAFYRIYKSKTVDEFKDALNEQGMFPQHLLAADTHGDILFVNTGFAPVRPEGDIDWTLPVDGNSSATAWRGYHPVDDLVVIKSPPAGFLQNNNVDPRLMYEVPPVETEGKPEYLLTEGWLPADKQTTRSVRAINVLSAVQGMTEAQAFELAFDVKTELSDRWLAMLLESLPAERDRAVSPFLDDLLAFDGRMVRESTSALKYVYWREALRKSFLPEDIEVLERAYNEEIPLPDELKAKFFAAVPEAQALLETAPDGLRRTYGDEFRQAGEGGASWARSGGSLETYPGVPSECRVKTLLCDTTLFPASYYPPDESFHRYAATGSRLMRLDFYSPEGIRSYTAHNPGISDDPTSEHADDQAERLMSQRHMKEVYFNWDRLLPNIVSETDLDVGLGQ
jgi:acyl-homoserine lactone acylase PvdQ